MDEQDVDARGHPEGQSIKGSLDLKDDEDEGSIYDEPLTVVNCKFLDVGCNYSANRLEVSLHEDISSELHLELALKSVENIQEHCWKKSTKRFASHENKLKIMQFYIWKQTLAINEIYKKNEELRKNEKIVRKKLVEECEKCDGLMKELHAMRLKTVALQSEPNYHDNNFTGIYVWKIENIRKKVKEAIKDSTVSIFSDPFYTAYHGYKVRAQIFLNGVEESESSFVSIFFQVLPSEYDDTLSWPFTQKISFALLKHGSNNSNDILAFCLLHSFDKPSDEPNVGIGYNSFFAIELLKSEDYARNDQIFIKIRVKSKKHIPK